MTENRELHKIVTMPSGMKLVYAPSFAVRSVAIGVFVGAGVVSEEKGLAGISHFIEHSVFKGTTNKSSFEIVNDIDSIGAQINAYTAKSYTCFHTVSLDANAEKCAETLSDLYFNPTFEKEEIDKERRVVIEEINECEDTPDDVCAELLLTEFFKGNPLEKPILGYKKTLNKMTPEMLREYHKKWYVADNTVLSVAGNISERDAIDIAERYFERNFGDRLSVPKPELLPRERRSGLVAKKKKIEQAHVAFGFDCFPYDSEMSVASQLMTVIFSLDMSSRLFQSVREKLGLCYSIMGYPSAYKNNGIFIIQTSTSIENVEKAIGAIKREIELLLENGVADDELKKGKEQLKTSLVLGQESTASMMRSLGAHAVQTGELYDIDARIKKIDSATKEDVLRAAKKIFDFDGVSASFVAKNCDVDILKLFKEA